MDLYHASSDPSRMLSREAGPFIVSTAVEIF
jgi:hypothetical protein